jgi:hypothetical protein
MELKVVCNCGQKYKFDVEPINGRMPMTVNCPVCGLDGTPTANDELARMGVALLAPTPPAPPTGPARVTIQRAQAPPVVEPPPIAAAPPSTRTIGPRTAPALAQQPASAASNSMVMGILGAVIGAAAGTGIVYGVSVAMDFRFPLFGTVAGILTGLGARLMYRGRNQTLGVISAVLSGIAIAGALLALFGSDINPLSLISVVVGAGFAYRAVA